MKNVDNKCMKNELLVIVLIIVAFLIFLGMLYILFKKNSNIAILKEEDENILNNDDIKELENKIDNLKNEINEQKSQNKLLNEEVKKLEESIISLKEQKAKLLVNKKKLEELQQQKSDLFATVVHDIKNPASAMQGLVQLLNKYELTSHEQQEIMEGLLNTSNRIVRLVEDVSRILEVDEGISNPIFVEYQLNEIVSTVCTRYSGMILKKKLNINKKLQEDLPLAMIDDNKIDQVIDNLVNNAIKFSPPGTEIEVNTYKEGDYICVEVEDNGYGLNEEEVSKSFDKGVKLGNKPTGGESSTGLGLWIVKRIVEEHCGRVWVKSKEGFGSTFAFKIPIKQETLEVA